MNEQNNIALINSVYAAFGKGDIETILSSLTSDVVWTMDGPAIIPFAGIRRGQSQVKGFFDALATTQSGQQLKITEMIAKGDTVASLGRYSCTVSAISKRVDSTVAHFFTIRDGKIASFVDLLDTAAMADAYTATGKAAAH